MDLTLHFLGDRTYLHGTTLFDALADRCRNGRDISFRISRMIKSDRVGVESFQPHSSETGRYAGTLVWDESGGRRGVGASPLAPTSAPQRLPFDERSIVAQARFEGKTVVTLSTGDNSVVKNLVALNKALLLRELKPPMPGQWLFVRLDLARYVETFDELRLTFRANLAFSAVSSEVHIDGRRAGSVVFSWLKT